MTFKISSALFLITTVIFAGLYLSEKESPQPVVIKDTQIINQKTKQSQTHEVLSSKKSNEAKRNNKI